MSARKVFFALLSLSMFLGLWHVATAKSVPTDAEMPNQQAQEEDDLQELMNQIRREKFDLILPQVMREHNIDMWIHVARKSNPDPLATDFGSTSGVFIFTDRGGDRIERAVLGRRWRGSDYKLVEECGAYDIIGEAIISAATVYRREMPGGPETEYDHRFKGVGEFVAERDPKRIGVNYREKLGPALGEDLRYNDGISLTDYNLLVRALGDEYAERLVSAEYLIMEYISRPVKSEIVLLTKMRKWIAESLEKSFDKIVPGVTKFGDIGGSRNVTNPDGTGVFPDRINNDDYVFQKGDLIQLWIGRQSGGHMDPKWEFGNFYETVIAYGYVLREGETELPPKINKAWADAMKVHKILEDNIKVGRTGGETLEILKRKVEEEGFIYVNRQLYYKDLDPEKTQVALDLHALGKASYAPRISPLGPDWQRDMTLPLNHHFVFEYFLYIPMPEWGVGKHLRIQLHDGAIVTERGVEYLSPPPTEIHLIK